MKSDVLICIFNYRHDDNARRWYNILSSHFDTYVLDSGNSKVNNRSEERRVGKEC